MRILFVSMQPLETRSSAMIRNKLALVGFKENDMRIDYLSLEIIEDAINYDGEMNDLKDIVDEFIEIPISSKYNKMLARKPQEKTEKNNLDVTQNKSLKNVLVGKVKKIYNYLTVFEASKMNVKNVKKLEIDFSKYDYIVSSSDPKSSHLIVEEIYKKNKGIKAKWVQFWGDPMLHDITRNNKLLNPIVRFKEKKLISKASRVVYVSPFTLEQQKKTYPNFATKMFLSNQPSQINEYIHKKSLDKKGHVQFGYIGAYYSDVRNIMPLYKVFQKKDLECMYKLNIAGPTDLQLKESQSISVKGSLSYKASITLESQQDVIIAVCNRQGNQIPAKIYYTAGYNKPIIVIVDGDNQEDVKKYLNSFGRYIICENNENSIVEALIKSQEMIDSNISNLDVRLTTKYFGSSILGLE